MADFIIEGTTVFEVPTKHYLEINSETIQDISEALCLNYTEEDIIKIVNCPANDEDVAVIKKLLNLTYNNCRAVYNFNKANTVCYYEDKRYIEE